MKVEIKKNYDWSGVYEILDEQNAHLELNGMFILVNATEQGFKNIEDYINYLKEQK
jgi:hypothetical protein